MEIKFIIFAPEPLQGKQEVSPFKIETISGAINPSQMDVNASFFLFFFLLSFAKESGMLLWRLYSMFSKIIWWKEIWPLSYMKSPPFLPTGWIKQDVFLFFWWMVMTFKILLFVFAFQLEMDMVKKIASNKDVHKGLPGLTWNSSSCNLTCINVLFSPVFFLDKTHALVKLYTFISPPRLAMTSIPPLLAYLTKALSLILALMFLPDSLLFPDWWIAAWSVTDSPLIPVLPNG